MDKPYDDLYHGHGCDNGPWRGASRWPVPELPVPAGFGLEDSFRWLAGELDREIAEHTPKS